MLNLNYPSYRLTLYYACVTSCLSFGIGRAAATDVDGFTEPYQEIDVAAAEMGLVSAVYVREGDRVTAGQLLVQLEDQQTVASLNVAKAEMDARSRAEGLKLEAALQSQIYDRLLELKTRDHASDYEVMRAKLQRDVAQQQYQSAEEERVVRRREYERLEVQLKRRQLCSPIDGIVIEVLRDPGEFASPSEPIVLRVVQINPLLVVFAVPAHAARTLRVKQAVALTVESQNVQGLVEFVSPKADPQSGTTRVRVRIDNPDEKIPCGASCTLQLPGHLQLPSLTAK